MSLLSFVLAFGFLGVLGFCGIAMLVMSSRRLLRQVHLSEASSQGAYPMAIIIPFGVLGMLGIVAASLAAIASKGLFRALHSPAGTMPSSRRPGEALATARMLLDTGVLALGFALLALAIVGIYRVVWIV